jgi:ABC-type transport system substrate-binding protein
MLTFRRHAYLFVLLALILAAAPVAVSACGGGEAETTVAEGTPVPGGTFRMALSADPTSIDPVNS